VTGPSVRSAVSALLLRGLVAGVAAGLLAGAVGYTLGEPEIDRAIVVEERAAASEHPARPDAVGPAPVSRGGQRFGLFLATGLYGGAMGGLFALLYAAARGRVGPRRESALAPVLAGALFLAGVLVPFLKYPANPPAVGDPDTIVARTLLYVVMVAISLLALLAAARVGRGLRRGPAWGRPVAGVGTFIATVAVAFLILPGAGKAPPDFPAELLWDFRIASLGVQLTLWTALGGLFAVATERARRR
jgi:hypothetical protein